MNHVDVSAIYGALAGAAFTALIGGAIALLLAHRSNLRIERLALRHGYTLGEIRNRAALERILRELDPDARGAADLCDPEATSPEVFVRDERDGGSFVPVFRQGGKRRV